jgi:Cu-Zn family superoxide dismutase
VRPRAPAAVAEITPTKGNDVGGTVTFAPASEGVKITARLTGLDPGPHGFHVHERGDCSADDASSAGDHFNPTGAPHGGRDEMPSHVGDMGNIVADAQGNATLEYVDKQMTLAGEKSILGKAVTVYASADDLDTQPSGASGDRIGCGIIEPSV